MAADLAALGAPAEVIERWRAPDEPAAAFEVFPENWSALELFLAASNQWRTAGMAGAVIGLDYNAVRVVADSLGLTLDADLLARLQVAEQEAGGKINERITRR